MISAAAFGIEVIRASYGEELVKCPFHEDRSPSAWFSPAKGLFWCSVCHLGLNVRQLAERLKVSELDLDAYADEVVLPDFDLFPLGRDPHWYGDRVYAPYFEERGVPRETIDAFGVEWNEGLGAAVLPVENGVGDRVGGVLRYREGRPRYRRFGKMMPLWPWPKLLATPPGSPVVVTEGPWSAMRLHSVDSTCQAFSTLGARATAATAEALRHFDATVLYDRDSAGEHAAERMMELAPTMRVYVLALSPDDMDDRQLRRLLAKLKRMPKSGFDL